MTITNDWVRVRRCAFALSREALTAGARVSGNEATLFLATEKNFHEGEIVLAEVAVEGDTRPAQLMLGTVKWQRGAGEDGPRGICLTFAPEEREAVLRLLTRARDNAAATAMRKHPRFPTALPVRVHDGRGWRECRIATLSLGGAHVLGAHARRGTRVHVKLERRFLAPKLRAEVVWAGDDEERGVGLRFLPSSRRALRQLWDAVRAASRGADA